MCRRSRSRRRSISILAKRIFDGSTPATCGRFLLLCRRWVDFGKGVLEIVGVLAGFDDDGEFAGNADELSGAGVGNDGDTELRDAAVHGRGMLQYEGAGSATEGSGYALHGDVASGAL